jgi:hypothetical protein
MGETSRNPAIDYFMDVARGNVPGCGCVNKFGRSTNVDTGATDIWDRANSTNNQDIWIAPTQARIHSIVSTSLEDSETGGVNPQGDGARIIQIYGLIDWDTAETSEVITLDGTTAINTNNSYIIIHRMKVLTKGNHASGPNVGYITATAATDLTITAQINPGEGQTQMAIYGIPSIQKANIINYYASFNKSLGVGGAVDISLKLNPEPNQALINFLVKHTQGLISTGTSLFKHQFLPYLLITGPAIIKIQARGSTNNLDVSAGFDLVLVHA